MKRIYWILILLFLVLLPALYLCYESRETVRASEKQKQEAFAALRESVRCPAELLKIEETHPFEVNGSSEKSYLHEQLKRSKTHINPKLTLLFEADDKQEKGNRITFQGNVIRVRSESYVTLFNGAPLRNRQGCIFKVRVSGRGRIWPFLYGWENLVTGKKENEISIPPYRISSLFARDYYFTFPAEKCQDHFSIGIRMRGNLDIEEISVFCARDSRDNKMGIMEGKILETSEIPDPAKSPYPDCMYALKVKPLYIEKWLPVPEEFILIAPAFKDRKRSPESYWKKGDIIRFSMIRFQDETEAVRQIQQADTLDDFLSERYSLTRLIQPEKLKTLTAKLNYPVMPAGKKYVSGYDRPQNPPLTDAEKAARSARIAAELAKMKKLMATMPASPEDLNRQFESIWVKNREKYQHADGVYWCRQGKSYFAMGKSHRLIIEKDMTKVFESVKELSDYLLVHGVSMIVVICPHFYDISARLMNPEIAKLPDYNAAGIAEQLLQRGVEALYFSDEILAHAHDYELLFYYPGDAHPARGVQQIAAKTIAGYLKKAFPKICQAQYRPEQFTEKPESYLVNDTILSANRKLWKTWFPQGKPSYREVLLDGKTILPVSGSPIFIYGNSFLTTPGNNYQYLMTALTHELKMGVGVMSREWIHPLTTMSMELLQEPERFLKGRKVCVFYYGVPHFLQTEVWNIRELDRIASGTEKSDSAR